MERWKFSRLYADTEELDESYLHITFQRGSSPRLDPFKGILPRPSSPSHRRLSHPAHEKK
jgi:hypothetical protein